MCYTYLIYIYSYIRHGHTCILPLGLMDGGPDSGDTVPETGGQFVFVISRFFADIATSVH